MNINDVRKTELSEVMISIRIKPKLRDWLRENKLCQSRIFKEACKELGYEE